MTTYLVQKRNVDHVRIFNQISLGRNILQGQIAVGVVFQHNPFFLGRLSSGTSIANDGLFIGILRDFHVSLSAVRVQKSGWYPGIILGSYVDIGMALGAVLSHTF